MTKINWNGEFKQHFFFLVKKFLNVDFPYFAVWYLIVISNIVGTLHWRWQRILAVFGTFHWCNMKAKSETQVQQINEIWKKNYYYYYYYYYCYCYYYYYYHVKLETIFPTFRLQCLKNWFGHLLFDWWKPLKRSRTYFPLVENPKLSDGLWHINIYIYIWITLYTFALLYLVKFCYFW